MMEKGDGARQKKIKVSGLFSEHGDSRRPGSSESFGGGRPPKVMRFASSSSPSSLGSNSSSPSFD